MGSEQDHVDTDVERRLLGCRAFNPQGAMLPVNETMATHGRRP
jgi:hypothetical protein